ncbi:MAG: GntR family transcriptional regulator [Phycisphaerae bacterium]
MHERDVYANPSGSVPRLSYKFQRLREQIRQTILSGGLPDQLPGERELARRFNANAKTINKALADLAVEGLVRRFIGRGTFVARGDSDADLLRTVRRTVHLALARGVPGRLAQRLRLELGGDETCHLRSDVTVRGDGALSAGPGFFRATEPMHALVFEIAEPLRRPGCGAPDEAFLLSLARRQISTVLLGGVGAAMRVNAVAPDFAQGAFRLTEYLFDLGRRAVRACAASVDTAELRAALEGYRTACRRRGAPEAIVPLESVALASGRADNAGCLLIGGAAVEQAESSGRLDERAVALLDVGDPCGERARLVTYEFDAARLTGWVARLAADRRPGTVPMQVLVPGQLQLRGGAEPRGAARGGLCTEAVLA